ncbi:MAG: hypothetical protein KC910_00465 [Candidatus Eremiobacteraeota bacterium]|nr:hypothetical protein [Candidatus Eremiobacteraeota bacterium]
MSDLSPHYEFAHRTLPRLVHDQPERFEQLLNASPPLGELWKGASLAIHRIQVKGVGSAIIIEMPPPTAPAEAFMVAVVKTTPWRYITLERTRPEFGEPSMLGEWTSTSRSGLGPGPEPTLSAFAAALASLEAATVGFDPLDLQPTIEDLRQVQSGQPVTMSLMKFVSCHACLLQAARPEGALGLGWWNFIKRRRLRRLFPILVLRLLGHRLVQIHPDQFEQIGLALSGNALRFGIEAAFIPEDEDPVPEAAALACQLIGVNQQDAHRLLADYSASLARSVASLNG